MRGSRHEHGDVQLPGQNQQSINVIGMFMSNQNGGKRMRIIPGACMRLKVSRQEIPASTRIHVVELGTIALFPRLPLASTETETPMAEEYAFPLWKRE